MENLHQFVNGVANLWNVHQKREALYKNSMTLDNLGSLRQICSHGYISSLLFKKEIQWIFDDVKCALSDGDIRNFSKKEGSNIYVLPADNKPLIARMLQDQEYHTIRLYKNLLNLKSLTADASSIFSDHLEKLCDISLRLNKELTKSSPRYFARRKATVD